MGDGSTWSMGVGGREEADVGGRPHPDPPSEPVFLAICSMSLPF